MGFESRAISAWVTKQIVTILVKPDKGSNMSAHVLMKFY